MKEKQSIIVNKSHPDVHSRGDAVRIAKKYVDRLYTVRETKDSFRFRQFPPSECDQGSYSTDKVNEWVSIVYCNKKRPTK